MSHSLVPPLRARTGVPFGLQAFFIIPFFPQHGLWEVSFAGYVHNRQVMDALSWL